jgi:glycosyltransferase involved in cell wall biosynthesis
LDETLAKNHSKQDLPPMKRVSILHYAGPPIIGGVESTIYHHARLLSDAGYKVEVIAGRGEQFHPSVRYRGIPEIDSRHPRVQMVAQQLAEGTLTEDFNRLRDELSRKLHPILDLSAACIVHNALTLHKNLALTAALRQLSDEGVCRMIAWSHDFAWQDPLYIPDLHPGQPWDLLREPWPGVQYVVVSEHRRERLAELLNLPPESICVATPGIDIYQFLRVGSLVQTLAINLDLLAADPLMLLPARITRRKNIEFAIQVTAALRVEKPLTTLVVTGPPGPHNPKNAAYLTSLRHLRASLGLKDQVHFLYEHGQDGKPLNLPDEAVGDFYRLSDLLIFPSQREGFGIPVLEAGLTRLPVFAAAIPSIQGSVGELGHLFDPNGDPKTVARQIASFISTDDAYRLRRRVIDRFSWQALVTGLLIPLIEEAELQ